MKRQNNIDYWKIASAMRVGMIMVEEPILGGNNEPKRPTNEETK